MENKKFLEKTAELILSRSPGELQDTLVIFPNKRPEIFLKKYLTEKITGSTRWIPEMSSIDEFIIELSPVTPQDSLLTWFELYEIHKKLEGNHAQPPDEFINYAPVMLSDFNDADLALADVKELFTFLSKAKALERWHPDGTQLTDFEKNYLGFYKKLLMYYETLKKNLLNKGMGTKGMVYRTVAENISNQNNLPWKHLIFAGFNALTPAEEKLITELRKKLPVTLLWDADEYYIHPKKHDLPWQEAGLNLKKNFKSFKINNPQWIENLLTESNKKITMVAAPGQISQVKFAGQLIQNWSARENIIEPVETAIVLSDENLLIPLLTSLPHNKLTYNVTMGYPLALSSIAQLFFLWVELLVRQEERKNKTFNTALVLSLLQNPAIKPVLTEQDKIISGVSSTNSAFINTTVLKDCFGKENELIFSVLFNSDNKAVSVFNRLIDFLNLYKQKTENNSTGYKMLNQETATMLPVLKKLSTIVNGNKSYFNLKVFQRVLNRLVSNSEISLKGEPLDGIQIMGMLETRLLDFKRLIILSANEGHLPKNSISESFISLDIRREFNLPLPDDKHAISAYHFFRLLQRTEEVVLIYNSEVGNLGAGEKSRFLYQLEIEAKRANPNLQIEQLFLKINPDNQPETITISIPKTGTALKTLDQIAQSGFSPSALNQFIECSLKYYFSYILKLKPPKQLTSTIEADVFGTIVHDILQTVYQPDLNKKIDPDRLKNELENLDTYINNSLKSNYATGDIKHGKNLLIVQIIKKYLQRFIKTDIENLKKEPRILRGTELELKHPVTLRDNKQVLIKGTIDRVDEKNEEIRISDYKTGSVKKSNVSFKTWENLLNKPEYSKAFQTLLYGWLYKQNYPGQNNIEVGLFSLRNLSEGFITPTLPDNTTDEWTVDFEKIVTGLLEQLFNPAIPFQQTTDDKNCQYCDFKGICNR